ncbi:MAG: ABC transporter substrate-binding protein [Acidobacteria bacterium]|nr:ABC transporter substrate-binding protein [Acidobacteriota bacterium]MYB31776.1 ABC transporter substrate-binding protein [Acidobacteriota bacterium]MYF14576.1 ABC transporter substrate-binding protein [Acidobacteriota bacterium]MYH22762.1 ABC transporter substrate-binding protein [Acidobacteriota bacterium]MYI96765.1 ABC transporter substrate-binding protein [Acidobacteriota bacterium]
MRKRMSNTARMVALGGAMLVGAGCGGGGADPDDRSIKVGAIFDFTGPTADVGTDYGDGVRGFADWINSGGGIEGRPIDLIYQDYGYQVDRAEQLYTQFVGEGAVIFMGWGTGDTEALRLRIAEDEIPFSSASLSHRLGDPAEAPYNFLLATTYSDQFRIALDWVAENHGGGTPIVALMHNASPFGLSPARQGGVEFAEARGIDLTLYEMPRGAVDFTAEFARIRQSGAQYVVFQNTSGPAAVALTNARSLGLDVTFFCLNWCSNAQVVQLAGDAAEGLMGTMPYAPLSVDVPGTRVIREYLESRGESPEGKTNAYTQGWWTFAAFAEGIRRVLAAGEELTGANIKAALETFADYDLGGVTAPVTFTPTDHRGSKGLRIFRVEEGRWTPFTDFVQAPGW